MSSPLTEETDGLPIGTAIDAGATVQAFVARHTMVGAEHAKVIRGLLDLHRGVQRVVDVVPDLCFSPDVTRCQNMLGNTLHAAATAYLALHGRRWVPEGENCRSFSTQLLAASRETVEHWLTAVATARIPKPFHE